LSEFFHLQLTRNIVTALLGVEHLLLKFQVGGLDDEPLLEEFYRFTIVLLFEFL